MGVYGINQGDLALNSGNYDLSYHGRRSMTFMTNDYLEYYLTLLGWIINNGIWNMISDTGLFAVPFVAIVMREWLKVRGEGGRCCTAPWPSPGSGSSSAFGGSRYWCCCWSCSSNSAKPTSVREAQHDLHDQ